MSDAPISPGSGAADAPPAAGDRVPGVTVDQDRYCIRCGYSLRGLFDHGKCPECGTDVALSLREPTLAAAAPEYLATLRRGLSLVLNGILLFIILMLGALALTIATGGAPAVEWLTGIVAILITAMMLWGLWLFTQPDPGQVAVEAQNAARRIVRGSVAVLAATSIVSLLLSVLAPAASASPGAPGIAGLIELLNSLAGLAAWAVQFFATMRYTRWLGGRVPDQHIVRRTKTYAWLLPVLTCVGCFAAMVGPLIALVLYWNLLDRLRKHVRAVMETGEPARLPKMLG